MAIRLSGGVGPVRVSTGVGGGAGCLTWAVGAVALFALLAWPYLVWDSWAVEIPYLIVVGGLVGGAVAWMMRTVKRHKQAESERLRKQFDA